MKQRKPNGFFSRMSDEELVTYAKSHYSGQPINAIQANHSRLYDRLRTQGLISRLVEEGVLLRMRLPPKTLQKYEYILGEIKRIMTQHNLSTLPPQKELSDLGYSSIGAAIVMYHGGFIKFRNRAGLPAGKEVSAKGAWKDREKVLRDAQAALRAHGWETLPSESVLYEHGYGGLVNGMQKYHGGIETVRELMGVKRSRAKMGSWESPEYAISYALNFLSHHPELETVPSSETLFSIGEGGLANAICKYHGGYIKFREMLNQAQGRASEKEQLESLLKGYLGDVA